MDWLLVMRRFDNHAILDRLAAEGSLPPDVTVRLARAIWHAHQKAVVVRDAHWVATLGSILANLANTLCNPNAAAIDVDFRKPIESMRALLSANTELLAGRQAAGFVRRCHGDLHLNNIVLINGEPTLFDAIEFDEELATIDVLYDLAFLIMDLWHRGMRFEANTVLNHYFQHDVAADEWQGLALLPLFLALRASIRAMVGMHKLLFRSKDTERRATIAEIHSYVILAKEMLVPQKPQLIVIGGMSGTGKTTLARMIAPRIGAPPGAIHLRTDVERKLMHKVELNYRLPATVYTPASRDLVYLRVMERAECVLQAGYPVVVDAVFLDTYWRDYVHGMAQRAGMRLRAFWLEAEPEQMLERVTDREGDASDANAVVVTEQLRTVTVPPDWERISTRGELGAAADAVLAALGRG